MSYIVVYTNGIDDAGPDAPCLNLQAAIDRVRCARLDAANDAIAEAKVRDNMGADDPSTPGWGWRILPVAA